MAAARSLAVLGGAVGLALAMTRRAVVRVDVQGSSMAPALRPGDRLVAVRALPPRRRDIVAVADPRHPARLLVKRVVTVLPGAVEVRGDNPVASTDSRAFGSVPLSMVAGRVVWRYWPPTRRGRVTGGLR